MASANHIFMQKSKFKASTILWLFFYLAIFSYSLNISLSRIDPDFPWHLRIGKQIVDEERVPSIDYYNHTILGQSWVDHEWLFNVFLYKAYDRFGNIFLNVFFSILVVLQFLLIQLLTCKFFISVPPGVKFFENCFSSHKLSLIFISVFAYAITSISPLLGIRMQIAGNTLFLTLLFILALYNSSKKIKYLFFLPFIFVFWANLHGSFLIGLFVLWAFVIFKYIEFIFLRFKFLSFFEFCPLCKKDKLYLFLFALLASLSTLLNPYGAKLFGFLNSYKNTAYMTAISEWRPIFYFPIPYYNFIYIAFFLASLLIIFYQLGRKTKEIYGFKKYVGKINIWQLFLSLFFLALTLKSKRHFPLFLISSLPLIIQFFYFEFATEIKIVISKKIILISQTILIVALVIFSFHYLRKTNFVSDPFNPNVNYYQPNKLAHFLKKYPDLGNKKVYNGYGWGGYFLWVLPEMKLFIDGRMPQINFKGHTLLEEYLDFRKEDKAKNKLDEYNIDLVVLEKKQNFRFNKIDSFLLNSDENNVNNEENYFTVFLNKSPEWKIIYEDEIGVIYERQKK